MKKALFLCTGNYYRSRFAEELINYAARQRGIAWHADSKGMARNLPNPRNPGPMASWALERLSELAVKPRRHLAYSESVQEAHFERADLIIAVCEREHRPMMEKLFPHWDGRTRYWDVEDYPVWTSQQTFRRIEESMENLLREL